MRKAPLVLSIVLMTSGAIGLILASSRSGSSRSEALAPALSNDSDAERLIEQLVGLGDAAAPLLVETLNSPRPVLAEKAKQVLLEQFDAWRWPATADSSARFQALAEALGQQTAHFAPDGRAAALDMAARMLSWPLDERYLDRRHVLACCEKAMVKSSSKALVAHVPPRDRPAAAPAPAAASVAKKAPPPQSAAKPSQPAAKPAQQAAAPAPAAVSQPVAQAAPQPPAASSDKVLSQPEGVVQSITGSAAPPASPQAQPNAPVALVSATGVAGGAAVHIPSAAPPQSPASPGGPAAEFAGVDSWDLFRALMQSDAARQARLQTELTARGFNQRELALGAELLNPDVEARVRVVGSLIGSPGVDPTRWLWQAARDPHPEVRLTALGLLATSQDPRLADEVQRVAGLDADPRIQRLAQQIGAWRNSVR